MTDPMPLDMLRDVIVRDRHDESCEGRNACTCGALVLACSLDPDRVVTVKVRCRRCGAPMSVTGRPPFRDAIECSRHTGGGTQGPSC